MCRDSSTALAEELGPMTAEYRDLVEHVVREARSPYAGYAIGHFGRVYSVTPEFCNGFGVLHAPGEEWGLVSWLLRLHILTTGESARHELPQGEKVRLYRVIAPRDLRAPDRMSARPVNSNAAPVRACQRCHFPARAAKCEFCLAR